MLDCSFELSSHDAGRQAYDAGHIPGARYVHLEHVLSAEKTGTNGRHPLPGREAFAQAMASLGRAGRHPGGGVRQRRRHVRGTPVVDAALGRAPGRGRARWRHGRLEGRGPAGVHRGAGPAPPRAASPLRTPLVSTLDYEDVKANIGTGRRLVLDARAPDRFRGENETMDPIGGHIPGAKNRLFKDNLGADGRFKPAAQLRGEFDAVTGGRPAAEIVHQCGSGVTACHNLLAMEVAGLPGAALYPGSWSEWSAQPGAPIATGAA